MSRRAVYLCVVLAFVSAGCPSRYKPPASYTTTQGQHAYTADQLIKDLTALSQTAINLNAATGPTHLSDQNTKYVRDFALGAGDWAWSYAAGDTGSLVPIQTGLSTLLTNLSADAQQNTTLMRAIAIIQAGVAALTGGN